PQGVSTDARARGLGGDRGAPDRDLSVGVAWRLALDREDAAVDRGRGARALPDPRGRSIAVRSHRPGGIRRTPRRTAVTCANSTTDLNADLGEGFRNDARLLDLVTSASISCGAHAGDEAQIRATLKAAQERGVPVGAHPSYPDREGFGRRERKLGQVKL